MGCNTCIHYTTLQSVDHDVALCLCLVFGLNERERQNKGGGQC